MLPSALRLLPHIGETSAGFTFTLTSDADDGFYSARSGRTPALEFINALTRKQREKIFWVLAVVERERIVPAKYFQKLSDTEELWEVRADFGGNAFRLLGFFDDSVLLVLVSGFVKKTEHTPVAEIDVATARRRDYLRRKASHDYT